jgi:L-phenylalanine/L-methionine N-acetyltransferase
MTTNITIRGRTGDDWRGLLAICRALPPDENPLGVAYPGDDLARTEFAAPNYSTTFGLVAEIDGAVVGEIGIERNRGRQVHSAHIVRFMVAPTHQGSGIGRQLLEALINLAENSLNLTRIDHLIPVENAPALNLHRKQGFVIEGKFHHVFFRDGRYLDAFLLARVRDAF